MKKTKTTSINKDQTGIFFVLPFIIIFLTFGLWPLVNTFRLSLTDTMLMSRTHNFTGLKNFVLIFNDPSFLLAMKNTAFIWILNFIPQLGLALLFSVWFTSKRMQLKGVGFLSLIHI